MQSLGSGVTVRQVRRCERATSRAMNRIARTSAQAAVLATAIIAGLWAGQDAAATHSAARAATSAPKQPAGSSATYDARARQASDPVSASAAVFQRKPRDLPLIVPEDFPLEFSPWDPDTERDPEWAPIMEEEISTVLGSDYRRVFPDIALSVECFTFRCFVTFVVPTHLAQVVDAYRLDVAQPGPVDGLDWIDDPATGVTTLAYRVDLRWSPSPAEWRNLYNGYRAPQQAEIERIEKAIAEGRPWR